MAFEIASRAAFREGVPKANPRLLEPIMRVEVVTPEEYMGDIIGDLNSRRGNVLVWTNAATQGNLGHGSTCKYVRLRKYASFYEPR